MGIDDTSALQSELTALRERLIQLEQEFDTKQDSETAQGQVQVRPAFPGIAEELPGGGLPNATIRYQAVAANEEDLLWRAGWLRFHEAEEEEEEE